MADQYIVSARKYRPQTFDTVVGQEHITTTLKNAIRTQHLAHAYLFCGPRGVGKTTCARILAKTINCAHPTPDMEACGVCENCRAFQESASFNIFELDAASNNSVDDIRELVNQVRFAPQQGKYKIYIIDEVHMLSAAAFNAFLKTLEEPPPYAIFILATTEKHKILPTILSRCQIFDFKRITTNDIVGHLRRITTKEQIEADDAALHIIAQKSEGCMRDALSMLDRIASFTNGRLTYASTMEHLNMLDADFYFRLVDSALAQDLGATMLQLDQALEQGFEGDVIVGGLSEHFRNLLLCKDQRMAKLLDVPQDHKKIYYEKANQISPSYILSGLNLLNEAEVHYKSALNKRLHLELCLIRLCYLQQFIETGDGSGAKKKDDRPAAAPAVSAAPVTAPAERSVPVLPPPPAMATRPETPPPAAVPVPKPEPAPQQQQAPPTSETPPTAERQPNPAMPPQNGTPVAAPSQRMHRNWMQDVDAAMQQAAQQQEVVQRLLTLEDVIRAFGAHLEEIRQQNKGLLHAQFSMMKLDVFPPDEIRFTAPNELSVGYVLDHRSELIEMFNTATGVKTRITTLVNEEQKVEEVRVLSRNEVYDQFCRMNPSLAGLRDALNLQIEF